MAKKGTKRNYESNEGMVVGAMKEEVGANASFIASGGLCARLARGHVCACARRETITESCQRAAGVITGIEARLVAAARRSRRHAALSSAPPCVMPRVSLRSGGSV